MVSVAKVSPVALQEAGEVKQEVSYRVGVYGKSHGKGIELVENGFNIISIFYGGHTFVPGNLFRVMHGVSDIYYEQDVPGTGFCSGVCGICVR